MATAAANLDGECYAKQPSIASTFELQRKLVQLPPAVPPGTTKSTAKQQE
ncbi:conserved hypothetical protein [Ricinus communis]|uniref:Uncharacterized protein n=1 Tax=Ricinus communis TaxID=3988 RepID=B9SJ77_RICCO|nr:conserved hypothetical protein [Ricinus communis]